MTVLKYLIPAECVRGNVSFDSIKSGIDFYLHFLDNSLDLVPAEFLPWRLNWLRYRSESLPNNPLQALIIAEEMDSYPSLAVLVQILGALSVTTATNERSFSFFKYLKTSLQNTTKEVRLNGLALLYVHRDINVDFEQVIAEFPRKN